MRGGSLHRRTWLVVPALVLALVPSYPASAQSPADPPSDTATPAAEAPNEPDDELARKHFQDGKAAGERGDWAAAYTSYRAGYAVQEHFTLLAVLGDAASHLGKFRDAAEYSALYLQKAPANTPAAARAAVQKTLDDAKTRVGVLLITAPPGADVFVDHAIVGKAPLGREVFVEPGRCEIEARAGAEMGSQALTVAKGTSASVTLVYGVLAPPEPTASASAGRSVPSASGSAGPAQGPRKELLIGGAAVAGAAAIVGAVLLGVSTAKQSDEAAIRDQLVKLGKGNVCAPPNRDARCDQAKDAGRAYDSLINTGAWMLIGAGAAAGATAIYYFVTRTPPSSRVEAAAVVTPQGGGGTVSLRF